jgi:hypothetical protein
MPNYEHSVIYAIADKETNETLYIGSSTNFKHRMLSHKSNCGNQKSKDYNMSIYKHIRELNGWDNVKPIILEEYNTCENRSQLLMREQEYINGFNSIKNSVRAYKSEQQRKEDQKLYNENRKGTRQEYFKQYEEKRKGTRQEYYKQYEEKRKEQRKLNSLKKKEQQ